MSGLVMVPPVLVLMTTVLVAVGMIVTMVVAMDVVGLRFDHDGVGSCTARECEQARGKNETLHVILQHLCGAMRIKRSERMNPSLSLASLSQGRI